VRHQRLQTIERNIFLCPLSGAFSKNYGETSFRRFFRPAFLRSLSCFLVAVCFRVDGMEGIPIFFLDVSVTPAVSSVYGPHNFSDSLPDLAPFDSSSSPHFVTSAFASHRWLTAGRPFPIHCRFEVVSFSGNGRCPLLIVRTPASSFFRRFFRFIDLFLSFLRSFSKAWTWLCILFCIPNCLSTSLVFSRSGASFQPPSFFLGNRPPSSVHPRTPRRSQRETFLTLPGVDVGTAPLLLPILRSRITVISFPPLVGVRK